MKDLLIIATRLVFGLTSFYCLFQIMFEYLATTPTNMEEVAKFALISAACELIQIATIGLKNTLVAVLIAHYEKQETYFHHHDSSVMEDSEERSPLIDPHLIGHEYGGRNFD